MRVANTVELKNKTNKILREVMKGNPVIITHRGKPAASIAPLTEDDLEDFVLQNSPKVRRMIASFGQGSGLAIMHFSRPGERQSNRELILFDGERRIF